MDEYQLLTTIKPVHQWYDNAYQNITKTLNICKDEVVRRPKVDDLIRLLLTGIFGIRPPGTRQSAPYMQLYLRVTWRQTYHSSLFDCYAL